MREVLKVVNLKKSFGKIKAVNGITFSCNEGEISVILGPTGAGKTTTLRLIAGLEQPDEGEIYLDDTIINDLPPFRRSCAMTFEDYALYPHMSVFDNIASPLRAPVRRKQFTPEDVRRIVVETAKLLEIDKLLDRKPSELSGGQRQRVALGRTLVRKPRVFLLDEPIAHLDAALRHRMRAEMKRIFGEVKTAVVYVTHDYLEALALADKIIVLRNGEIQQTGTPQDVYFKPTNVFVASFLGDPPMNFLEAALVRKDGHVFVKVDGMLVSLGEDVDLDLSRKVMLGIRPSDMYILKGDNGGGSGIKVTIRTIEPLGNRYIVTALLSGGKMIKIKLEHRPGVAPGDKVIVGFLPSDVHLFDAQTERALWHGGESNRG